MANSKLPTVTYTYPLDIQDGSPFIILSAYEAKSFTNASDYKNSISNTDDRTYQYSIALYIPKSLKFSYNPQINAVNARVDKQLIDGVKSGDLKSISRGLVATGANMLALDSNVSMLGQGINLLKDFYKVDKGQILDPKQLNMFSDAPFMTYNLNYRFIPENLEEAISTDLMLRELRNLASAKMADTKSLSEYFKLKEKLPSAVSSDQDARADLVIVERELYPLAKEHNDLESRDANGNNIKTKEAANKQNAIKNRYKSAVQKLKSPDNKNHYENISVAIQENPNIKSPEPKKSAAASVIEKTQKVLGDLILTAQETYTAIISQKFDIWEHPSIFDLYVVVPGAETTTADGRKTVTVASNREIDMYRDAKGLILSSLNISFIESATRDDIPLNVYGLPAGWEVDMTFTSITKHVVPKGGV